MGPPFSPCDSSGDIEKLPRAGGWYVHKALGCCRLEITHVLHLKGQDSRCIALGSLVHTQPCKSVQTLICTVQVSQMEGRWGRGESVLCRPLEICLIEEICLIGGGLKEGRFPMQRETPRRQNKPLTVNCNGALSDLKSVFVLYSKYSLKYIYI